MHFFIAFQPAGEIFASLVCVVFVLVMIGYGVSHTAYFSIEAGAKVASRLGSDAQLSGKLGNTFFQRLVAIIYIPLAISSLMMLFAIVSGRSLYPRWTVIFLPIVIYLLKARVTRVLSGHVKELVNFSRKSLAVLAALVFLVLLTACNAAKASPTGTHPSDISPTAPITSISVVTSMPPITPSPAAAPAATIDPDWVTLQTGRLQMNFPQDWILEQDDCDSGSEACIVQLSCPDSETLTGQLTILPVDGTANVDQADQDDWNITKISATTLGAGDLLRLISVDEMEVDGLKAIKRLYEYPLVDIVTGQVKDTQYNYRVLFVDDEYTYTFELQTISDEEFAELTVVADQVVDTISVHR